MTFFSPRGVMAMSRQFRAHCRPKAASSGAEWASKNYFPFRHGAGQVNLGSLGASRQWSPDGDRFSTEILGDIGRP